MVNLFRRFQQPLLIALTVMIIISFVVLYNLPKMEHTGPRMQVAVYNGRPITMGEWQRTARRTRLLPALGFMELNQTLKMLTRQDEDPRTTIVLRGEAEAMGIMSADPSDAELKRLAPLLAEIIVKLPAFQQKDGAFSNEHYQEVMADLMANKLAPFGFTKTDLEEMAADELRMRKIKELMGSVYPASPADTESEIKQRFEKIDASVVRLKLKDFTEAVQPSDKEVADLYEKKKDTLKTPEKRKVKVAAFTVPPVTAPLSREEIGTRQNQMSELMVKAREFAKKVEAPGAKLDDVAKEAGVTIVETPAFSQQTPPIVLRNNGGVRPRADAGMNQEEDAAPKVAFQLTKEAPNSPPVPVENGYLVMQLVEVEPVRQEALEEVKAGLIEDLKGERGKAAMQAKGKELREKIAVEIKGGKDFTAAAEAAGVKAEKVPAFSQAEPPRLVPEGEDIASVATTIRTGETMTFGETSEGGVLVHVDQRSPADEGTIAKQKEQMVEQQNSQNRELLFQEWLRTRLQAAKFGDDAQS